ncbi:acetyl-CoA carboxylase biotin carboxyl carrier protein subunit [Vulcanimicrobium alpinum]|uniref:Biotin carboxyl carrier protein of acetyl-CoA carboxylase n=1 Tax=Vulcanimicrobium alpinum TaxID=3016050 RepID=A0AAN2CBF7_UNVUL|nr:acetyl-CoA carboxylase biotin carboxyl carrier protein [Vulcanimicrobium alpinum]BDE08201.1 acetyl-CoA carboxylase biotin carboxyl carrier protein subunit [Vulcanimicrobium alpinum]
MEDETSRIRALGEIAAEFDLDAIRVRTGDSEIEIVRRDPAAAQPVMYAAPPAGAAAPRAAAPAPATAPDAAAATTLPRGARAVTAPVVGVFYRAASPGAEPFVEVGSRVSVGDTLCILEAMKLMNEINSEFAGTVLRVLPENGELVTLGQELVWIEV